MKTSSIDSLSLDAIDALKVMGKNVYLARKLRGESLIIFSSRCFISVPTLKKVECGDPSVSIGVIASILSILDDEKSLTNLAAHERDTVAQSNIGRYKISEKSKGLSNDF
jgi:transcriptional regulator with XRE-family HTH domain